MAHIVGSLFSVTILSAGGFLFVTAWDYGTRIVRLETGHNALIGTIKQEVVDLQDSAKRQEAAIVALQKHIEELIQALASRARENGESEPIVDESPVANVPLYEPKNWDEVEERFSKRYIEQRQMQIQEPVDK